MPIDYTDINTASIVSDFYKSRDDNLIQNLVEYVNFDIENSKEAFAVLLNEMEAMPPIRFCSLPKAQHSLWVAKCTSLFLDSYGNFDRSIYLYGALWHDLIEDSLKFKRININNDSIDNEILLLYNRLNLLFENNFLSVVFEVIKKLTKSDAYGYFDYVDQIYLGNTELVEVASFIKNCDMIVNCETCHVFSYIKQIRQFLKYLKKINIDRYYFSKVFIDNPKKQLIYDSNRELAKTVSRKIKESLKTYEIDNNVSEEGKSFWKKLAILYGEKYGGYSRITPSVTQREIIYNPVKIFDGTISTFKAFLDPHEPVDTRKQKELKFQSEGRDYLALIGLWNLAEKFDSDTSFYIKGF